MIKRAEKGEMALVVTRLYCVEETYGYGCDAYVVELVISSGVTWRDYPEKRRKH